MNPDLFSRKTTLAILLLLCVSIRLAASEDFFPYGLHRDEEILHLGALGAFSALNFLMLREVQDAPTGQEKIDRGYEFDKDEINPMDRFFMRPWNSGLSRTSDVMLTLTTAGTGAALLTLPGLENGERITLGVMFTELLLWSLNVQFFLKYTMPRYRPYNYYSGTLPDLADKPDSRESFPSGHAMNAVSAAVFFHTIYSELRPAGPAWPVWTAYIAAAGTAALRVASGRHFASDVLIGSAIGACLGYLIPLQNRMIHSSYSRNNPRLIPLFSGTTPGMGLVLPY